MSSPLELRSQMPRTENTRETVVTIHAGTVIAKRCVTTARVVRMPTPMNEIHAKTYSVIAVCASFAAPVTASTCHPDASPTNGSTIATR